MSRSERKEIRDQQATQYQLVHDCTMPHYTSTIALSPDEKYLLCTGSYPHQTRVYDLNNQAMKFQRNQTGEPIDVSFLGQDWKKFALLLSDKFIEIHSQQGKIFRARVPKQPRCCVYDPHEATYIVGGSSSEIYMLDLFKGKFKPSFQIQQDFINNMNYHHEYELLFCAGQAGISAVDFRVNKLVGKFQTEQEATSVAVHKSYVCVGQTDGHVCIYDVRASGVLERYRSGLKLPIKQLKMAQTASGPMLGALDGRQLRFYENIGIQGKLRFYLEPQASGSGFVQFSKSGLIAMACEQPIISWFYVPDLGPAPAWAKDLDAQLTEIDVQQLAGRYLDHRFCTRAEIDALGLAPYLTADYQSSQQGNSSVQQIKPYMHGFQVPLNLYRKAIGQDRGGSNVDVHQKQQQNKSNQVQNNKQIQIDENTDIQDDRFNID